MHIWTKRKGKRDTTLGPSSRRRAGGVSKLGRKPSGVKDSGVVGNSGKMKIGVEEVGVVERSGVVEEIGVGRRIGVGRSGLDEEKGKDIASGTMTIDKKDHKDKTYKELKEDMQVAKASGMAKARARVMMDLLRQAAEEVTMWRGALLMPTECSDRISSETSAVPVTSHSPFKQECVSYSW